MLEKSKGDKLPRICEICNDTKTVEAFELTVEGTGTFWVCDSPLSGSPDLPMGKAKCKKPEKLRRAYASKYGNTRTGETECPLCNIN